MPINELHGSAPLLVHTSTIPPHLLIFEEEQIEKQARRAVSRHSSTIWLLQCQAAQLHHTTL
jgi:hypothetical protein